MKKEHKDKISDAVFYLLTDIYPLAKTSLIELETRERIKALGAFTDLRDVFDHFYLAIKYASSNQLEEQEIEKIVNDNISSANEHLRRAAVEPLETLIEDLLAKIIQRAKYNYLFYPIGISSISNEDIMEPLRSAQQVLSTVRQTKGQLNQLSSSLTQLEDQYKVLAEIERKLPPKMSVKIFTRMVLAGIGLVLLGVLIGRISTG